MPRPAGIPPAAQGGDVAPAARPGSCSFESAPLQPRRHRGAPRRAGDLPGGTGIQPRPAARPARDAGPAVRRRPTGGRFPARARPQAAVTRPIRSSSGLDAHLPAAHCAPRHAESAPESALDRRSGGRPGLRRGLHGSAPLGGSQTHHQQPGGAPIRPDRPPSPPRRRGFAVSPSPTSPLPAHHPRPGNRQAARRSSSARTAPTSPKGPPAPAPRSPRARARGERLAPVKGPPIQVGEIGG